MKDTKERICAVAQELFSLYGYNDVSMRQIAQEAGTTIGNMTYHFKKKEDLLIALGGNIQEAFECFFEQNLQGEDLLEELINTFSVAESNRNKYVFYYEHLDELVNASDYMLEKTRVFQKKLYDYYLKSLCQLQKDGIVKEEVSKDLLHLLSGTFVNISTSWNSKISLYSNELIPHDSYAATCYKLLNAFLNNEYILKIG